MAAILFHETPAEGDAYAQDSYGFLFDNGHSFWTEMRWSDTRKLPTKDKRMRSAAWVSSTKNTMLSYKNIDVQWNGTRTLPAKELMVHNITRAPGTGYYRGLWVCGEVVQKIRQPRT